MQMPRKSSAWRKVSNIRLKKEGTKAPISQFKNCVYRKTSHSTKATSYTQMYKKSTIFTPQGLGSDICHRSKRWKYSSILLLLQLDITCWGGTCQWGKQRLEMWKSTSCHCYGTREHYVSVTSLLTEWEGHDVPSKFPFQLLAFWFCCLWFPPLATEFRRNVNKEHSMRWLNPCHQSHPLPQRTAPSSRI